MSKDDKLFKKGRITKELMEQQDTTAEKVLTVLSGTALATALLDAPETACSLLEDTFDAMGSWFD